MYKIYILLFAFIIVGCTEPAKTAKPIIVNTVIVNIDSLQNVISKQTLVVDSLNAKVRQQKILIKFTALKCHKYAAIVKKNPSQSVFIIGWIDRSFTWINEK